MFWARVMRGTSSTWKTKSGARGGNLANGIDVAQGPQKSNQCLAAPQQR